jgi:hypothetical protein
VNEKKLENKRNIEKNKMWENVDTTQIPHFLFVFMRKMHKKTLETQFAKKN